MVYYANKKARESLTNSLIKNKRCNLMAHVEHDPHVISFGICNAPNHVLYHNNHPGHNAAKRTLRDVHHVTVVRGRIARQKQMIAHQLGIEKKRAEKKAAKKPKEPTAAQKKRKERYLAVLKKRWECFKERKVREEKAKVEARGDVWEEDRAKWRATWDQIRKDKGLRKKSQTSKRSRKAHKEHKARTVRRSKKSMILSTKSHGGPPIDPAKNKKRDAHRKKSKAIKEAKQKLARERFPQKKIIKRKGHKGNVRRLRAMFYNKKFRKLRAARKVAKKEGKPDPAKVAAAAKVAARKPPAKA
eukprot:NODE_5127_length_979_cov_1425.433411_g4918_i0.p1 GENE.NODE_5127_length_979_cov_1425.433411_g4918_i0~~NODE_5127_length_979_cov_1425.433411_g4918_i0.p1  ORF type:complete len:301 (+),score=111.10 NODE_5127_length_979_cov_1425.433411_g4918_i0:3-905(+)